MLKIKNDIPNIKIFFSYRYISLIQVLISTARVMSLKIKISYPDIDVIIKHKNDIDKIKIHFVFDSFDRNIIILKQ